MTFFDLRRRKRSAKGSSGGGGGGAGPSTASSSHDDDGTWDCSVCTFKNHPEAFKCSMCDVRKGTSTRYEKSAASAFPVCISKFFFFALENRGSTPTSWRPSTPRR